MFKCVTDQALKLDSLLQEVCSTTAYDLVEESVIEAWCMCLDVILWVSLEFIKIDMIGMFMGKI